VFKTNSYKQQLTAIVPNTQQFTTLDVVTSFENRYNHITPAYYGCTGHPPLYVEIGRDKVMR
jgi:hypothetical protein